MMEALNELVKKAIIDDYAGGGFDLTTYALVNEDQDAIAVLLVDTSVPRHEADIIVFARIEGEYIIIEANKTDRPLEDVLVANGIPREKIICAHWGESLPDAEAET
jgi:hypothetical protein